VSKMSPSHVERRVPQVLVVLGETVVAQDKQPSRPPAAATCRREATGEADGLERRVAEPRPHRSAGHLSDRHHGRGTAPRLRSITSCSGWAAARAWRACSSLLATTSTSACAKSASGVSHIREAIWGISSSM